MSYLPCQNPNCRSYGKPHPNCRCHGDMAEGGEASFCSTTRAHDRTCEYFADGGEAVPADDLPDEVPAPDQEVPADDLPDESPAEPSPAAVTTSGADVPADDLPESAGGKDYGSTGQQIITGIEGAAQGVAGPIAPFVEHNLLGEPYEAIDARAKENPWVHGLAEAGSMAASTMAGVGLAGRIAQGAGAAAKIANFGKIGSAALKGAITMGLFQASDEASKALMGQGKPEDAVNPYFAMGASVVLGGLLGGGGAKLGDVAAKQLETNGMKAAAHAEGWLAGMGAAAAGEELAEGAGKSAKSGYEAYKSLPKMIGGGAGALAGASLGSEHGELLTLMGNKLGSKYIAPLVEKIIGRPGKYAVPTVMRWLSEGAQGSLFNMIDYADKVAKGTSLINNGVEALFKPGVQQTVNAATPRNIQKLHDFIDGGGMDQAVQQEVYDQATTPTGFAEGGAVESKAKTSLHDHDEHIAQNFPEQNVMIQAGKGRISSYLSAQRPQQHVAKLAFDDEPDQREQKRSYDKALHVAVNPLGVLEHVKSGTIEPDHIRHLNAMYPELTQHLQQKLTQRIVKDQEAGKKPNFVVRQGLSMLLGTPLSGELTPQGIQAAQSVFANARSAQQQPQPQQKPKRGTATLSKSSQAFLTDDQSREKRQQKV